MTEPTLFEYAQKLRDEGMARASVAQAGEQPEWSALAYDAICSLAKRQSLLHVDDVLTFFTIKPHRYNAWGAVWMKAIRNKIIERTGRYRPCTVDAGKHAHQYPIYRSLIYFG